MGLETVQSTDAMMFFGYGHHRNADPLRGAPDWVIELFWTNREILAKQEKIMTDMTNFDAAMADLKASVDGVSAKVDDLINAHDSGDQPAIDAATAAVQSEVSRLKDIASRAGPTPEPKPFVG